MLGDRVLDVVDGLGQVILAYSGPSGEPQEGLLSFNHLCILTQLHGQHHNVFKGCEAMARTTPRLLHHDNDLEFFKRALAISLKAAFRFVEVVFYLDLPFRALRALIAVAFIGAPLHLVLVVRHLISF